MMPPLTGRKERTS